MKKAFAATIAAALASLASAPALAVLAYDTPFSVVSQDFNSLASTGTSQSWTNASTLGAGWYLFRQPAASPVALTTIGVDNGGLSSGQFGSYGSTGSEERALGGLGSGGAYFANPSTGAVAGWIAFAVQNTAGHPLGGFNVGYDGEQWRTSNRATQTMVFEYGFGATFDAVTSWVAPGGTFDFTSPVASETAAAVNGNVAGLAAGLGGFVNTVIPKDATLWLRWVERNDSGNDHLLAIDNFTFSAIPEPTAALFGSLVACGLGLTVARRTARD